MVFGIYNYVYYFGLTTPQRSALFTLGNFNAEQTYQTLDSFTAQKSWLNPSALYTTYPANTFQFSLTIPNELTWPKYILPIEATMTVAEPPSYGAANQIVYPSLLILILDSNGFIRGKLYVQFSTTDQVIKAGTTVEQMLSFNIPADMQGQKIGMIGEFWGGPTYGSTSSTITLPSLPPYDNDPTYGQVPANPNGYGTQLSFDMLGYSRIQYTTSLPWPSSILQFGPVFSASGFLSATLVGAVVYFRSRILRRARTITSESQALLLFAMLAIFFLALFIVLVSLYLG